LGVNVLIFIVIINGGLYLYLENKQSSSNAISTKYNISLEHYYPGMTQKEIDLLLQETWDRKRSLVYEPFTQFKEKSFVGKFVNISKEGFRKSFDQGIWPSGGNKGQYNIFLLGGSTAFGYGLVDEETVPSWLQKKINDTYPGRHIKLFNMGRSHYYSTQERLLFETLLTKNIIPDMVIFLDGLNDFYYNEDIPLFTKNFELFTSGGFDGFFNLLRKGIVELPIFQLYRHLINKSKKDRPDDFTKYQNKEVVDQVIKRYLLNKKLIEAVADSFNIKTLFVWQPVPTYKLDLAKHIFSKNEGFGRHSYGRIGYEMFYVQYMKGQLGDKFVWCADITDNSKYPLYLDLVHYTAHMSEMIAECISENVIVN